MGRGDSPEQVDWLPRQADQVLRTHALVSSTEKWGDASHLLLCLGWPGTGRGNLLNPVGSSPCLLAEQTQLAHPLHPIIAT